MEAVCGYHSIGKFGFMSENLTATDRTAAPGEKWLARLAGMEAMTSVPER
jgi:hypothetical protein